jgi:DNA-binding IscR family transcriptional regulator
VLDGPLALVHGERPESLLYEGPAEHLREVWVAVRAALRQVLERTSLEQIVGNDLPPQVTSLSYDPTSWTSIWATPDQE